jgi:hypothetical protein
MRVPARTVSLALTSAQEQALQACFSPDGAPLDAAKVEQLLELSLQSWLDVFTGAQRYRSLSELYLDWLAQIFTVILPDSKPTTSYLYQRLNFPHGMALYLCRVLLAKGQSRWRDLARAEIEDALQARIDEARAAVDDKQGQTTKIELTLSKAARMELGLLLDAVSEHGERVSPPQLIGTYSDRAVVSVTAAALLLVQRQLEASQKGGTG